MHLVSISDVHIKTAHDEPTKLFLNFLQSKELKNATHVVLLGDIFDMMVGNKKAYLTVYEQILDEVAAQCRHKKLIYISGNHDFGTSKILKNKFKDLNFSYQQDPLVLHDGGKSIYLSHGDEVDDTEKSYRLWKRIYQNQGFQFMVDYFLPYRLIRKLGDDASKRSRTKGKKQFNYDKAERKYLERLEQFLENYNHDYYILGHTHIKLVTQTVANNGFVPLHKCFVSYREGELELISLR